MNDSKLKKGKEEGRKKVYHTVGVGIHLFHMIQAQALPNPLWMPKNWCQNCFVAFFFKGADLHSL